MDDKDASLRRRKKTDSSVLPTRFDPYSREKNYGQIFIDAAQESNVTVIAILTLVSLIVRLHRISNPSEVVFDEVHFGGFATKYLHGAFFMDVHPPLGKLLVTASSILAGFGGHFDFKEIGLDYIEHKVPYVTMRMLPGFLGVLLVPMAYITMRNMGFANSSSVLAAVALLFGLFVIALVGLSTLNNLWLLLGDLRVSWTMFGKHFLARALCLIAIPMTIYLFFFEIHFLSLPNSGTGSGFMSPIFQSTLKGNEIADVYEGHVPTKKHLHSHDHRPPVTENEHHNEASGYGQAGYLGDTNDHWRVEVTNKKGRDGSVKAISSQIRLIHMGVMFDLITHRLKSASRWVLVGIMLLAIVITFIDFSPLTYGFGMHRSHCNRLKWGKHWDWSCLSSLDDPHMYPPRPADVHKNAQEPNLVSISPASAAVSSAVPGIPAAIDEKKDAGDVAAALKPSPLTTTTAVNVTEENQPGPHLPIPGLPVTSGKKNIEQEVQMMKEAEAAAAAAREVAEDAPPEAAGGVAGKAAAVPAPPAVVEEAPVGYGGNVVVERPKVQASVVAAPPLGSPLASVGAPTDNTVYVSDSDSLGVQEAPAAVARPKAAAEDQPVPPEGNNGQAAKPPPVVQAAAVEPVNPAPPADEVKAQVVEPLAQAPAPAGGENLPA
ncbi:hypothetical protein HK405_005974 [Cladochytrium tenue]|nr:hypothetical protein HK405_005974 [Cladochytrium tenue]